MNKRKYSTTEREVILREFKNRKTSSRAFAKEHNISLTTIYTWINEPAEVLKTRPHELSYHQLETRLQSVEEQLEVIRISKFISNVPLRERLDAMKSLARFHSIHVLSAALDIPRGTYYNDILRAKGENAWFNLRRKELTPSVKEVFDESHGTFGAGQIAAALKLKGINAGVHVVSKIMADCGLESSRNEAAKKYKQERRSRKNELKELENSFTAARPNSIWVCDVTELKYAKGHYKIYLCVIIDIFARKVVAYKFGKFNNTHLVKETFLKAYDERKPNNGLVFHSDRGSPNISRRFYNCLKRLHVVQSLSRPYVPQDNAVIESFFRTLKAEVYYPRSFGSLEYLVQEVSGYIEEYNAIRPHGFNGGTPPNKTESDFLEKSQGNSPNLTETQGFESAHIADVVQ